MLDAINSALAGALTTAGPERASTVHVALFRSQSSGRGEALALTERVIKGVEQRTPYRVVGTPEGADVVLDGSYSVDAKGALSLTTTWTDNRTKKAVVLKTVLTPGPADVLGRAAVLSEFVVDGMKLLR